MWQFSTPNPPATKNLKSDIGHLHKYIEQQCTVDPCQNHVRSVLTFEHNSLFAGRLMMEIIITGFYKNKQMLIYFKMDYKQHVSLATIPT